MLLTVGSRVGPYEVLGPLGAGGMGEVYRARDATLRRDVALKVLPQAVALDAERLARFSREAQILASLNHANIAQIYGVEDMEGAPALVMELVEGPTLADLIESRARRPGSRLSGSPLSSATSGHTAAGTVRDALEIARQIADALEAAHEQGIIHRDLKPQNIKLRPDGTVKVLDFGLAKALEPASVRDAPAESPTITSIGTRVGTLLGTAAYMAPEQVKGRPADRRADIWAFGVVLYELLTGAAAFDGESSSEILARVIEREPDWSKLPAATPPAIVRLLQRAMVKDPKRRLQSIGDARLEIDDALQGKPPDLIPDRVVTRRGALALAALTGAAVVALGFFAVSGARSSAPTVASPGIRASIALPDGLYLDGFGPPELALSPDGQSLAFIARGASGPGRLYIRAMDSETAALVPGSETVEGPFFSPDGRWVAFAVGVSVAGGMPSELRKYSLDTGLTQTIAAVEDYFGGVWLDDGSIVFVNHQPAGLWKVEAGGGEPRQIAAKFVLDGHEVERIMAWPAVVPGKRALVVTDWGSSRVGHLAIVDLESRVMTPLGIEGSGGQVLPTGYLVYASPTAALMAVPFDPGTMRAGGTPVALMPEIAFGRSNVPVYAFSASGTLVYATGYLRWSRREPMRLVRASPEGSLQALPFEPDLLYRGFALSPDGARLAVGAWDGSRLLFDLGRGTRVALTGHAISEVQSMAWSRDGRRLAVTGPLAGRGFWGLVVESPDDPGRSETLVEMRDNEIKVAGWTADGKALLAWGGAASSGTAIFRLDEGQPIRTFTKEVGGIASMTVSPDGRWLAYDLTRGGPFQLLVMPIDGQGARVAVNARGGEGPRWSQNGRQLFFRRDSDVLVVDVNATDDDIHFGPERRLFAWDVAREYDVSPSGEFYSMEGVPGAAHQTSIQLRTRWFEEVERVVRR
jgi:serine/threonine-protein kinase